MVYVIYMYISEILDKDQADFTLHSFELGSTFRYYIQGPVICEKLPEYYPISARTILLIEEVMSEVLQKKCKLLPDDRYTQ